MNLHSFLKLVEIQTKVASVIPFLLGSVYVMYRYDKFNIINFLLFFCSLLLIDMTTTALNNYFDWKRASKKHGYNYEIHNSIERYQLKERTVITTILLMLAAASIIGILLVLRTNLVVLAIGALSFLIGICYSFGPLPISRTPFGEAFSGFFMGFVILFLSVYIHMYDGGILTFLIDGSNILLTIGYVELFVLFLVSFPVVCGIANIMLANNICDVEDDMENGRQTLPIAIGRKKAVVVFNSIYIAAYADILFLIAAGVLPLLSLAALLTAIPVYKGVKLFNAVQTKKDTFAVSVKSFLMLGTVLIITIFISGFFIQ